MKNLCVLFSLLLFFYGCGKKGGDECTNVSPESEEATISKFCTDNMISASKDESGIFYQIISPGTTPSPDLNDTVYVLYKGTFLNGTVVDESLSSPYASELNDFIDGWKIGLRKISKGGQIKMVVPSSLCYGCNGSAPIIPPNTILYFEVSLIDVKQMP